MSASSARGTSFTDDIEQSKPKVVNLNEKIKRYISSQTPLRSFCSTNFSTMDPHHMCVYLCEMFDELPIEVIWRVVADSKRQGSSLDAAVDQVRPWGHWWAVLLPAHKRDMRFVAEETDF